MEDFVMTAKREFHMPETDTEKKVVDIKDTNQSRRMETKEVSW